MNWLLAMLPTMIVVCLLTAAELISNPAKTDWWRNLQVWAVNVLVGMFVLPLYMILQLPALAQGSTMPFWIGALAYLIVRDFLEFLYHRAQHSIPILWSMHALHHSDPEMSALTTNRHFWGDQLIKAITIWPLAAAVVAPTPAMVAMFNLLSLWNFAVHSRLPFSFGPLSWLLNSSAYHRRHHSSLPEHYNSNFAALFPVFDVLFGSYNRPHGFPPTGLDRKPESLVDVIVWPVRHADTREPELQTSR